MSDTGTSQEPGEPLGGPQVRPRRPGWLTALMVVAGIILLLPGLCAVIFGGLELTEPGSAAGVAPFVVAGLAVGCFGIFVIWTAFRGPGPQDRPNGPDGG